MIGNILAVLDVLNDVKRECLDHKPIIKFSHNNHKIYGFTFMK